jgi:hypothetical protein
MNMTRFWMCLLLLFPIVSEIFSQTNEHEHTPSSLVPWFWEEQLRSPFASDTLYVDLSANGFQRYDPFFRHNLFTVGKGNIGHQGISMWFNPDLGAGGQLTLHAHPLYPGYILNRENVRFHRPEHVFTDLYYVLGANREQFFIASHNQKLHETFYIGGQYQVVNSPGFFGRMAAAASHVRLNFDFQSPTGIYQALGSMNLNRINNQESGGLADPEAFEQNPDQEGVVLLSAVSRHRSNSFNLNHSVNARFNAPGSGTAINLGRFTHNFSYRILRYVFAESGTPFDGFYITDPVIPGNTYDSTRVNIIENQLMWSNFPQVEKPRMFPFNLSLFLTHRIVEIYQPDFTAPGQIPAVGDYPVILDRFTQLVPGFGLQTDPSRFLSGQASGALVLNGYNARDIDLQGSVFLGDISARQRIRFLLQYAEKESPYFLSHFRSNYISWDNDFGYK